MVSLSPTRWASPGGLDSPSRNAMSFLIQSPFSTRSSNASSTPSRLSTLDEVIDINHFIGLYSPQSNALPSSGAGRGDFLLPPLHALLQSPSRLGPKSSEVAPPAGTRGYLDLDHGAPALPKDPLQSPAIASVRMAMSDLFVVVAGPWDVEQAETSPFGRAHLLLGVVTSTECVKISDDGFGGFLTINRGDSDAQGRHGTKSMATTKAPRVPKTKVNFKNLNDALDLAVRNGLARLLSEREEDTPFQIELVDVKGFIEHMARSHWSNNNALPEDEIAARTIHVLEGFKLVESKESVSRSSHVVWDREGKNARKDNKTWAFKNAMINAGITYSGYKYSGEDVVINQATRLPNGANRKRSNQGGAGSQWRAKLWQVQNGRPSLWKSTTGSKRAISNVSDTLSQNAPNTEECDLLKVVSNQMHVDAGAAPPFSPSAPVTNGLDLMQAGARKEEEESASTGGPGKKRKLETGERGKAKVLTHRKLCHPLHRSLYEDADCTYPREALAHGPGAHTDKAFSSHSSTVAPSILLKSLDITTAESLQSPPYCRVGMDAVSSEAGAKTLSEWIHGFSFQASPRMLSHIRAPIYLSKAADGKQVPCKKNSDASMRDMDESRKGDTDTSMLELLSTVAENMQVS